MSPLLADLARILPADALLSGPAAERAYDSDAYTVEHASPTVVALPASTEEVAAVVRYCHTHAVPLTPRGAGTGLSGGALPFMGGVVLSTKRLNRILDIREADRVMLAQAGVANKRLSDAVRGAGLHFAPDPSSQTVATLGGNIAENAGGPHTLKYGVTTNHILGLTHVAPDGETETFGGPLGAPPGEDPTALIVGAEGTTGIVTEAWVRLVPLPRAVETALIAFREIPDATRTVAAIISSGVLPAALEMVDRGILGALKAAFSLEYPPGSAALLLVECDGDDESVVKAELAAVAAIARDHGALDVTVAADDKERAKLWAARKKGVGAMGRLAPTVVTHDGVIPRSKLPEMLDFVYEVAARYGIGVANIFHAGDGNLHPCFYFDDREPGRIEAVARAGEEVVRRCLELGGSITGEHGVGVEKLDLMALQFSPEDLMVMGRVRDAWNPGGGSCNPCKMLPSGKGCLEHRPRHGGAAW